MDITKIFRWRSRVKTASPSVAGGAIETLASHTADINAHPDYLKKGSAVPTGQEATAIVNHELSPISHAKNYLRRGEALQTKEEFNAAKDTNYVPRADRYLSGLPMPHIVTAYVLNMILDEYVTEWDLREMVKHPYQETVGDGSQIVWIQANGYAALSDKTIGSGVNPVWLNAGVITASNSTVGGAAKPVWFSNGSITAFAKTIGSNVKPIFMNNGELTASSGNVGNTANPIYLESGELKASTKTAGSSIKPIWMNAGTITEFSSTVGGVRKPVWMKNGAITEFSDTTGDSVTPVYIKDGEFTSCSELSPRLAPDLQRKETGSTVDDVPTSPTPTSSDPDTMIATKKYVDDMGEGSKVKGTVGSTIKPIWLDDGTFKPISGPIGSERQPVYVNDNGEIVAANTQIPINGCYINTDGTDPAEQLGYGTWSKIAEIGSLGYIWARVEPSSETTGGQWRGVNPFTLSGNLTLDWDETNSNWTDGTYTLVYDTTNTKWVMSVAGSAATKEDATKDNTATEITLNGQVFNWYAT